MKKTDLDSFAQSLRQQRNGYVREFHKAEAALEAIDEERESELEEHAQEEQSARLLARLDDRTLSAINEIDAALQRILQGSFGACQRCHKAISLARLKALPATRLCKTCAAKNENAPPWAAAAESSSAAPVPPDLNLLNDRELNQTIRERLKDDGRLDLDELHVVCRKGVVHLSGSMHISIAVHRDSGSILRRSPTAPPCWEIKISITLESL